MHPPPPTSARPTMRLFHKIFKYYSEHVRREREKIAGEADVCGEMESQWSLFRRCYIHGKHEMSWGSFHHHRHLRRCRRQLRIYSLNCHVNKLYYGGVCCVRLHMPQKNQWNMHCGDYGNTTTAHQPTPLFHMMMFAIASYKHYFTRQHTLSHTVEFKRGQFVQYFFLLFLLRSAPYCSKHGV